MQLRRVRDVRSLETPLPSGKNERVELLAADRSVASDLSLEIDLLAPIERAEQHDVARTLEPIETPQLLGQNVGVVESREELPGIGSQRLTQRKPACRRRQLPAIRPPGHDQADPRGGCELLHQARKCHHDLCVVEASLQVTEVDVRKAARIGDLDALAVRRPEDTSAML